MFEYIANLQLEFYYILVKLWDAHGTLCAVPYGVLLKKTEKKNS